jgi:hypothetical protein
MMIEGWSRWARGYGPWLGLSAAATVATAALRVGGDDELARFLGPLPPVLTVAATGAAGWGALRLLERRGFWRRACASRTLRGLAVASVATLPFVAAAIAVDAAAGFPEDTNVTWPAAWLLYPAIAVVAEVALHLLPLAGLAWLSGWRWQGRALDARSWALIVPVAALEPLAQVALGSAQLAFVAPHVFLIGVVQLVLLRRYGYLPMIWFRLAYYLLWHLLWGAARLELLF